MDPKHRLKLFVAVLAGIALAGCQDWGSRDSGFVPNNSKPVVLYATSWCGYCQRARDFFAHNDVDYIEYDIDESKEGRRQFNKLRGRGVPLILVGREKIRGWNATAVKAALARLEASGPGRDLSLTASDEADEGMSIIKQEVAQEFNQERGYIIHLRDGRKIQVKDYWEKGNEIKYSRFGGIIGVKRENVVMIENRADGTKKLYKPSSAKHI